MSDPNPNLSLDYFIVQFIPEDNEDDYGSLFTTMVLGGEKIGGFVRLKHNWGTRIESFRRALKRMNEVNELTLKRLVETGDIVNILKKGGGIKRRAGKEEHIDDETSGRN